MITTTTTTMKTMAKCTDRSCLLAQKQKNHFFFRYKRECVQRRKKNHSGAHGIFAPQKYSSTSKMCMHLICKYATHHPSRCRSCCRRPCNTVVVFITKISTYLANVHVHTLVYEVKSRQTIPDLNLLFIQQISYSVHLHR